MNTSTPEPPLDPENKLLQAASSDPDADASRKIRQACQLLREVMSEQCQEFDGIRPPNPSLQADYDDLLAKMSDLRGGGLYYPYLGSGRGNGSLVELADGSVKYDMIAGIGVHMAGHSNVDLMETLVRASLSDTVMQGNLQQNLDSLQLCDRLVSAASETGAPLSHCFLSTSGATANENAIKMMFQARYPADRLIAFTNCFAGRTMALAQLTDRPGNRQGLPATISVDYVPFYDAAQGAASIQESVDALKKHLDRYPGRHAGMCMELVQGEGGYYAAPRDFFIALIACLRQENIPVFFDEVQTFGRTTRLFSFQHLGLDDAADIVTIGKMSQVCATLFTKAMKPRPGLVSQTFTGSTSSIHAAHFILDRLQNDGCLGAEGRTSQIHARFAGHFRQLNEAHPELISGPWGIGGMVAFTALDGSPQRTKTFLDQLYAAGVLAFPAGSNPTRVRMLPPLLVVKDEEIDEVCRVIGEVLRSMSPGNPTI